MMPAGRAYLTDILGAHKAFLVVEGRCVLLRAVIQHAIMIDDALLFVPK